MSGTRWLEDKESDRLEVRWCKDCPFRGGEEQAPECCHPGLYSNENPCLISVKEADLPEWCRLRRKPLMITADKR